MSIVESAMGKVKANAVPVRQLVPDVAAGVPAPGEIQISALPLLELSPQVLAESGILPRKADIRRLKSQYREIKRALLSRLSERDSSSPANGSIIMVASALPGEGKTFTSYNLAQSLASERDWTTVLIDADVARRHLTTTFGMEGQEGLLDVLSNPGRSLLDVARRTQTPGLLFIPAGSTAENATELMASARMRTVLENLQRANARSLVVFDSSPVLPTPESRALADNVGQIVFVVRAGHTLRSDVEAALALVGNGPHVGVVLNQYKGEMLVPDYYGDGVGATAQGDA